MEYQTAQMNRILLCLVSSILLLSCNGSKWETISGHGISDEPTSIEDVIYFEDENNGVIGGYTLISDSSARNDVKLSTVPTLYLTKDGGKNWRDIKFDATLKQRVRNAYLHKDTLICELDSVILFSTDKGLSFTTCADPLQQLAFMRRYLKDNKAEVKNSNFRYRGADYSIKELYQNDLASVIVCRGNETMIDYYFASFDKGNNWTFLQKDYGDNRQRFLLADKFLYCYHFPLGLQRLRLK